MVDSAFLYFHTRCSTGDEIAPFVDRLREELPTTYLCAGDGPIEGKNDDPLMGKSVRYGASVELYKVFRQYGIHAEGVSLAEGQGIPDEFMFREAARPIKAFMG